MRGDESGHLDPVAFGEVMVGLSVAFGGAAMCLRWLRNNVTRPLSWLHGVPEDEAANGEPIPPLPVQIRQLRQGQASLAAVQLQQSKDIEHIIVRLDGGEERFDRMEQQSATIEERTRQLEPNGGESLVDVALQTRDRLAEHLDHADATEVAMWDAIAATSRRVADRTAASGLAEAARDRTADRTAARRQRA